MRHLYGQGLKIGAGGDHAQDLLVPLLDQGSENSGGDLGQGRDQHPPTPVRGSDLFWLLPWPFRDVATPSLGVHASSIQAPAALLKNCPCPGGTPTDRGFHCIFKFGYFSHTEKIRAGPKPASRHGLVRLPGRVFQDGRCPRTLIKKAPRFRLAADPRELHLVIRPRFQH